MRVTLATLRNSASVEFQGKEVLSLQNPPTLQHPYKYLGDVITNSTPYAQLPTDAPTRARISFFGSQVTCFLRDPSCHIETPT
jgi:hypothetical protein